MIFPNVEIKYFMLVHPLTHPLEFSFSIPISCSVSSVLLQFRERGNKQFSGLIPDFMEIFSGKTATKKRRTHERKSIQTIAAHRAPKELAYYVEGNTLEPVEHEYQFAELINPVFTKDGDNLKVKVSIKYLDNATKAAQISQYELTLHKDTNWKIIN